MGGLLEELGIALSGGVAAAGKTASETLLEQAKQAALSLREENLVRITNLYAKEREKGAQEFTRGENKLTRETTVSESKLTRDQAKELAEKAGSRELLLHGQTIASQEKIAEEGTARAMALQASSITGQKELQASSLAGAKINAEALVKLTHELKEKERGVVDKTITDLSKYLPKDQAIAVTLAGLTKEQTELERTQLKSWVDMYISDTKVEGVGGTLTQQQKDKIAEGVTARLHYDPSAIVAKSLALTTGKPVIAPAPKNSFDEIAAKLSGKTTGVAVPTTGGTTQGNAPVVTKKKWLDDIVGRILNDFSERNKELNKGLLQ